MGYAGHQAHIASASLLEQPLTLPKSAKHFRSTLWQSCARTALCAAFLIPAMHLSASAASSSCPARPTTETADSEHPATQLDPAAEPKPAPSEKSEKYDVNRIGQRNTGKGVNLYSIEKERALGEQMAQTIDRYTKFLTDPDIIKYVSAVAMRVIGNSDAQVAFTIKIVDSDQLNIFALPGGFLYVDKGLLSELDSEAELAGLIAHEVAHVAARHATRYATRRTAWNMIGLPVVYATGPAALGAEQIGPLALRKFARSAELEADLLGMQYQYAAGYDPRAFIDALERLHTREIQSRANDNRAKHGFFSHSLHQVAKSYAFYPPTEERLLRLQSEISTMLPCRDSYITDTSEFEDIKAELVKGEIVLHRDHAQDGGDNSNGGPVLRRHPEEWQQPPAVRTAFTNSANPYSF